MELRWSVAFALHIYFINGLEEGRAALMHSPGGKRLALLLPFALLVISDVSSDPL